MWKRLTAKRTSLRVSGVLELSSDAMLASMSPVGVRILRMQFVSSWKVLYFVISLTKIPASDWIKEVDIFLSLSQFDSDHVIGHVEVDVVTSYWDVKVPMKYHSPRCVT